MIRDVVVGTRRFLERPVDESSGVVTIASWRFWACLILVVLSACTLAHDPLFFSVRQGFRYGCGVLCIMLSYIALSALFWDLMLFGKPQRANLFLQVVSFIPFTLFTARTFVQPPVKEEAKTLIGSLKTALLHIDKNYLGVSDMVEDILPSWVTEIFSHWPVALVLLFVVVALCFKSEKYKVGFLFCAFFVGFAGALSASVSWQFILGTVLLIGALALMHYPCAEQRFYDNWIGELGMDPVPEVALDVVALIMGEAYNRGRLSEVEYRTLVESRLARAGIVRKEDIDKVSDVLRRFLLTEKRFIRLVWDSAGTYLTVDPRLLRRCTGYAATLTICLRIAIVAVLGFIWLVSPFDIVPDALPFVGVLDDVAVGILSMKCIGSARNNMLPIGDGD